MILNSKGEPLQPDSKRRADGGAAIRSQLGSAGYIFPYEAANWSTQEMGNWLPSIRSPDTEINQYRDRMVGRSRDLTRNDGRANGGITRILDNTIGMNLRLMAGPDYRTLALKTGIKAFDATWADEFRRAAESLWRNYANNIDRYADVGRQLTMGQLFRLAMRHKLIDGEGLGVMYWMPERVGYGCAEYATALALVDPDRLSNPYQMIDSRYMRGGVEIDDSGVPVAYHIRNAEQNDWYNAIEANTWERVPREDDDGFRRVIHDYDRDRVGQHRGLSAFTPVIAHAKMLARYYAVELQAATIASTFGTYVTSPYDPAIVQDALGAGDDEELPLYQKLRLDWANNRPAMLNGAKIPTLAPGESIETVSSDHPHGNFEAFAQEMLRSVASALGLSTEQVTQDWSKTNYSSARAALLESWKTLSRRKGEFCSNFATPVYATWLAEAMDNGELPLPIGAPDYREFKTAYSSCDWLGVARGWVDPVKEKQGAILGMDAGLSTLKRECAEQGLDWEEVLDQQAIEINRRKAMGLKQPNWAGNTGATEAAEEPEKPEAE